MLAGTRLPDGSRSSTVEDDNVKYCHIGSAARCAHDLGREGNMNPAANTPERFPRSDPLLNKWRVEERTSLDITTIYRKMKAGTFPQPVRVGRRRVGGRESDIAVWQDGLEVGTRL